MERLRGGESEFIRLVHSDTEVNQQQRQGEPASGQSFPSLRVPQHYKILLDPEKQKRLEIKGALRRSKTMPAGGIKDSNKIQKKFKTSLSVTGPSQNKVTKTTMDQSSDVSDDAVFSDAIITDANAANITQPASRNSMRKSRTPNATPKPSKHSITSPKKRRGHSPCALKVKSQSVPDFNMVNNDHVVRENAPAPSVTKNVPMELNKRKSSPDEDTEKTDSPKCKSPTKSTKKATKNQNADKLDDLTDKAFRRKLFNHYNKSREDRNAQNAMESSLGEKKSFLSIKMADIVNSSERHHSQNRILKRLMERCTYEDTEEGIEEIDKDQTLPQIETKQETPSKSQSSSQRLNLPSLRNSKPSRKTQVHQKSALLPTVIKSIAPFNQNNNNHQSEVDPDSNLENWPEISSPKAADQPSPPARQTVVVSPALPVITEDIIDVAEVIGRVLDTVRKKSMSQMENSKHKAMLMKKSCWDKKLSSNDSPSEEFEPVHHDVIVEEETAEGDDEHEVKVVFEGDVKDCKYLRGYDPPQSRPIQDVEEYFTNAEDDEPKLKNITFFHAGQFNGLVTQIAQH